MSFWDIVWFIIISFAFVAYLMVLFSILGDLFRDHETSGLAKALWVIFLIIAPFLTALIYLIVRGGGMARRSVRQLETAKAEQDRYIQEVATTTSPAGQIAQAKELLDSGAITPEEYEAVKARALA